MSTGIVRKRTHRSEKEQKRTCYYNAKPVRTPTRHRDFERRQDHLFVKSTADDQLISVSLPESADQQSNGDELVTATQITPNAGT